MKEKKINHPLRIDPSVIAALKVLAAKDNRKLNNYIEVKLAEIAGVTTEDVGMFANNPVHKLTPEITPPPPVTHAEIPVDVLYPGAYPEPLNDEPEYNDTKPDASYSGVIEIEPYLQKWNIRGREIFGLHPDQVNTMVQQGFLTQIEADHYRMGYERGFSGMGSLIRNHEFQMPLKYPYDKPAEFSTQPAQDGLL
jgi:hypothetical protein